MIRVSSEELLCALRVLTEPAPDGFVKLRDVLVNLKEIGIGVSYAELRLALVSLGARQHRRRNPLSTYQNRERRYWGLRQRDGAMFELQRRWQAQVQQEIAKWLSP